MDIEIASQVVTAVCAAFMAGVKAYDIYKRHIMDITVTGIDYLRVGDNTVKMAIRIKSDSSAYIHRIKCKKRLIKDDFEGSEFAEKFTLGLSVSDRPVDCVLFIKPMPKNGEYIDLVFYKSCWQWHTVTLHPGDFLMSGEPDHGVWP